VNILRIVAAHDPGATVNQQQVEGQIEGGIIQAMGWSLLENFIVTDGAIMTDQLSTYLIPTINDIPLQVISLIDEIPDPLGPFGARGIGEITFIPLAPAIIDAIHNATGVWINHIPVTPEVLLQELNRSSHP
jgi:CO/xanthine dehydrogenase Mo-binding subunit